MVGAIFYPKCDHKADQGKAILDAAEGIYDAVLGAGDDAVHVLVLVLDILLAKAADDSRVAVKITHISLMISQSIAAPKGLDLKLV